MGLAERMLALHEKLAEARIERTVIGHQFSSDRQIERLVCGLYGRRKRRSG